MKPLLLIAITILAVGCGGKDESTTGTKPVEEKVVEVNEEAKIDKHTNIKEDINAIKIALLNYKISVYSYPTTDQGLQALLTKPADARRWDGPYFDDEITDPWGNGYGYRFPSQKGQRGPDIFSKGADGQENTADDIGNWQMDESTTESKPEEEKDLEVKEEVKPEEPLAETKPELDGVNDNELEERKGIRYLKNSDSPYTGKVFVLYENGQRMVEGTFKDGKPHGLVLQWHKNGQKESELNFKDGTMDGLLTKWHENGQKQLEVSWKDGEEVEGSAKYWNSKGEPVEEKVLEVKEKVKPEEAVVETKPVEEVSLNPNLKYEIKDDEVTITGCDKKASGELTIPASIEGKSVTSIGRRAFFQCSSLTSITISDSVTSIGSWAFRECTRLTSITFGENSQLTSIGERAFYVCLSLTSITIPDGVTSIGNEAFHGCSSLTSITIPEGVTSIRKYAFAQCRKLTSITIPDGVTSIVQRAFWFCESLTSITIPDSVTSIGIWAFRDCTSLKSITFLGDAPKEGNEVFEKSSPTIYRKPEAKGWGDTFGGRPVKLISEKP